MGKPIISDHTAGQLTPFEPNPDKILVAFSGGIHSGVCSRILQDQGFSVNAVFFKTALSSKDKLSLAEKNASILGIPLQLIEIESELLPNKNVLLQTLANVAKEQNVAYIASGHSVHLVEENGKIIVANGNRNIIEHVDELKKLPYEILKMCSLPMAEFDEEQTVEFAHFLQLVT